MTQHSLFTQALIAIGAGVAAAIFFIVPVKGSVAATLIAMFAPLPVMLVGLAFSPLLALGASIAGFLVVWFSTQMTLAFVFAAWSALPGWQLTRLAWLARPATTGDVEAAGAAAPDGLVWYPIGRLVMWAAGLASAFVMAILIVGAWRQGGYGAFIERLAQVFTQALASLVDRPEGLKLPPGVTVGDLAQVFTIASLPQLAAWGALTLCLNLWLAGRIARISGRLTRPWTPVADGVQLPKQALYVFFAALALCLIEGAPRMIGAIVAASLAMAFALQGYAALHVATRPLGARPFLLSLVYSASLFLFPVPTLIAAAAGFADASGVPLRGPQGARPSS